MNRNDRRDLIFSQRQDIAIFQRFCKWFTDKGYNFRQEKLEPMLGIETTITTDGGADVS